MNTTESMGFPPVPQAPQEPVSEDCPAASGRAVTVVQDAAEAERQSQVAVITQDVCARPCASDPSSWPDLVLERLFRQLNIGDLMACSLVCIHWHQVTSDRRLQVHCLLQTYTPAHRRQLERTLDTGLLRSCLPPRCDNSHAPQPGEALSVRVNPACSAQALLCTTVRRMLQAEAFSAVFTKSPLYPGQMHNFLCSPDGRLVAVCHGSGKQSMVNLWEAAAEPVRSRLPEAGVDRRVLQMAFSSDGCKLRVLYQDGRVDVWHETEGRWHGEQGAFLRGEEIHKTELSGDGQRLGVVRGDHMLIYAAGEDGGWHPAPLAGKILPFRCGADTGQITMRFSDDARHLVCIFECRAFILFQDDEAWWQKEYSLPRPIRDQPVFDAHNSLLAIAYASDSDDGLSVGGRVKFWRLEAVGGGASWKIITDLGHDRTGDAQRLRVHPVTGYKAPVAFSPDGQLVALPHSRNCQLVYVLPVSGRDAWESGVVLKCGQVQEQQGSCELVTSIQFSASSGYLAVHLEQSIVLWQRQSSTWRFLLRIGDLTPYAQLPFAFSPDGFHCVASTVADGRDQISIWGPGCGGAYGCKYTDTLPPGSRVEKVLFAPDATRVLAVVSCRELVERKGTQQMDCRLACRFLHWQLAPQTGCRLRSASREDAVPVLPD